MASTPTIFAARYSPLSHRQGFDHANISRVSIPLYTLNKSREFRWNWIRHCSANGHDNMCDMSDAHSSYMDGEGRIGKSENHRGKFLTSNETMKKLRRYGISGILSYGLLNTAYYLTTFLFVCPEPLKCWSRLIGSEFLDDWFYVAPSPGRMGYFAAAERFLKIMAMVWAGSQVTKLVRAGGALALAPVVDRGLSWFTDKFNFKSQGNAFLAIIGACFGLAFVLFFVVTLLSA